ncbi:hypothetical protein scyTo_0000819 [Scyliorhinus torazame]|uniref:Uncharacterized protein n=1 Tax=Scyliorhinus torazame TaxID=75743 RepID=A0A401P4Q6_SCYTO|nr:hypothetical protein [Scyliorhinus torazame]
MGLGNGQDLKLFSLVPNHLTVESKNNLVLLVSEDKKIPQDEKRGIGGHKSVSKSDSGLELFPALSNGYVE